MEKRGNEMLRGWMEQDEKEMEGLFARAKACIGVVSSFYEKWT